MNILFFDTETTGVPKNYKAPVTDLDNWPRLVQLGYVFHDGQFNTSLGQEYIIQPRGFEIPESVSKIHGITQQKAMDSIWTLEGVLNIFDYKIRVADLIVGHNLSYDLNVLGAEYLRTFNRNPLEGKATYDTMLKGMGVCKLPGRYGQYKWPKLEELYFSLFGTPLTQTHTALDDIENTAKCYFEMKSKGL